MSFSYEPFKDLKAAVLSSESSLPPSFPQRSGRCCASVLLPALTVGASLPANALYSAFTQLPVLHVVSAPPTPSSLCTVSQW